MALTTRALMRLLAKYLRNIVRPVRFIRSRRKTANDAPRVLLLLLTYVACLAVPSPSWAAAGLLEYSMLPSRLPGRCHWLRCWLRAGGRFSDHWSHLAGAWPLASVPEWHAAGYIRSLVASSGLCTPRRRPRGGSNSTSVSWTAACSWPHRRRAARDPKKRSRVPPQVPGPLLFVRRHQQAVVAGANHGRAPQTGTEALRPLCFRRSRWLSAPLLQLSLTDTVWGISAAPARRDHGERMEHVCIRLAPPTTCRNVANTDDMGPFRSKGAASSLLNWQGMKPQ